jgi:hypothetical protein
MSLTPAEKRFIKRALDQANTPLLFVAHHIWVCRELTKLHNETVEPDMHKLQAVSDEVQTFVVEGK